MNQRKRSMKATKTMNYGWNFSLFLRAALTCFAVVYLLITPCLGGEISQTEAFFTFIRAVDPKNVLRITRNGMTPSHPCSNKWKGYVKCGFQATEVTEIRLENLSLSGIIDGDSLCKLQHLKVLSLAKNLIKGNVPKSILSCTSLAYLNLSNNLLSGKVPVELTKLKHLRILVLDISNNLFTGINPDNLGFENLYEDSKKVNAAQRYSLKTSLSAEDSEDPKVSSISVEAAPEPEPASASAQPSPGKKKTNFLTIISLALGIIIILLFFSVVCFATAKVSKMAKEKDILKSLSHSPHQIICPPPPATTVVAGDEVKPEESGRSELVFFVDEQERFKWDDLFEAIADLRRQTLCSSLYKVILKNKAVYAVKRLKKFQVSFEEFRRIMRQIGEMKHPNILPLVCYNSSSEEKLLIYKYQTNGSLLSLLEEYIEGKRDFPWKLRLSIAKGLAKGLDFIYQNPDAGALEAIPHGNLKPSNILLDENDQPLISEYGFSRFKVPKQPCLLSSSGYTAPEKSLSEQGDVYSFGMILLELLTGKLVEKTGIDLPKWVRAMVREEWTGEVFDKEVNRSAAREHAFPLLNVALKCVSNSPQDRPTMAEVMEKIDEMANVHEDETISTMCSIECCSQDFCLLHSVIPETWDTPGSNY